MSLSLYYPGDEKIKFKTFNSKNYREEIDVKNSQTNFTDKKEYGNISIPLSEHSKNKRQEGSLKVNGVFLNSQVPDVPEVFFSFQRLNFEIEHVEPLIVWVPESF